MNDHKNIKEVFVFGAGASNASGGAPLGKDLIWKYELDCAGLYRMEGGKPAEDDLKERNTEFINYGKFLQLVDRVYPGFDAYNSWQKEMKEAMTFTLPLQLTLEPQLHKRFYVDEMAKILQEKQDAEGIELLRQLTLEHIGGTGIESNNKLYRVFVKKLLGKSPDSISIISFNFDCLLHEDFVDSIYFDYLIQFDEIYQYRESYNKHNGIPLIKLNGSLDWAICQKCSKIKLLSHFVTKRNYVNLSCKNCREKLRPFIFLPHEKKNILVDSLWDKARKDLNQAGKVTVIGYSFPAYDQDVINLFKESMASDVELLIVDYADTSEQKIAVEVGYNRLKGIFSHVSNTQLFLNGFQGYLQQ